MTATDLAATLLAHQGPFWDGIHSRCGCRRILLGAQEWAEHVAEVLLAVPGIAIVDLPAPDPDIGPFFDAGCGAIAHVSGGDVRLHSVAWEPGPRGGVFRSPAKARELAAALLAAARAAETGADQ